jgi:hypothetical protein
MLKFRPTSTSHIVGIISMSHCAQPYQPYARDEEIGTDTTPPRYIRGGKANSTWAV